MNRYTKEDERFYYKYEPKMEGYMMQQKKETLFKIGGIEIIDYGIRPTEKGFNVGWEGKQASGEFEFLSKGNGYLDTGGMGTKFCRLFMSNIFENSKTDI